MQPHVILTNGWPGWAVALLFLVLLTLAVLRYRKMGWRNGPPDRRGRD